MRALLSTVLLGGAFLLLGNSGTTKADNPPQSDRSQPAEKVYPGSSWEPRRPEEVGLSRAKLDALRGYVGGRGCVVRHGYMVYAWGDQARRTFVYSAEKPWYAHFLFKALEEGRIPNLDQKVSIWEPRLNTLNAALGSKDRNITWRHLASQTSCYGVKEQPGTAFNYNDYQMALLWDTLFLKVHGVTYQTVDEKVLHLKLTDPIQCQDNPTFMTPDHGAPGSLGVSVRDFARFALFYLREGSWQGAQLISREHARMAVTSPLPSTLPESKEELAEMIPRQRTIGRVALPQKQGGHEGSYSWLWWTNGVNRNGKRHWPDAPPDAYGAFGAGGNAAVVIPCLDIVVVWSIGWRSDGRYPDTNEALKLLVESVTDTGAAAPHTRVAMVKDKWHINGAVTYPGAKAEGLLMNVRMVNAVFEDLKRPDFDAEANYLRRVRRVIEACDRHGAVVILGCYYQRQDQLLRDEKALRAGVVNVVKWIQRNGFTNVVLEIANEFGHKGFDHRLLKTAEGQVELIRLAKQNAPDLLVSTSGVGTLPDNVARASDFLLIHFNDTPLDAIPARIAVLKKFGKPIVCNEDEKTGEQGARAAELCVVNRASWGLMAQAVNQTFPFTFKGAADDRRTDAKLKELTSR